MRTSNLAAAVVFALLAAISAASAASIGTDSGTSAGEAGSELERAQAAIDDMEYKVAIDILDGLVESNPRVADAYNLLGFSYRKLKDYEQAERNYTRALRLEPAHRGALEYIGELYIETGRRGEAEAMLARLEKACPEGCNELEDLKAALAGRKTTSNW